MSTGINRGFKFNKDNNAHLCDFAIVDSLVITDVE